MEHAIEAPDRRRHRRQLMHESATALGIDLRAVVEPTVAPPQGIVGRLAPDAPVDSRGSCG